MGGKRSSQPAGSYIMFILAMDLKSQAARGVQVQAPLDGSLCQTQKKLTSSDNEYTG